MRPIPLTTQRGGINRLKVKGAARADSLYDLVNAYVTQAGTILPREGTIRQAVLDATTAGLMAMNGKLNVFGTVFNNALPAGYVDNVLGGGTSVFTPGDPGANSTHAATVQTLLKFADGNGSTAFTDSGAAALTWTGLNGASEINTQTLYEVGSLDATNGIGLGTCKRISTPFVASGPIDLTIAQDWTLEFFYFPVTSPGTSTNYMVDFSGAGSTTLFQIYSNGTSITCQAIGGWATSVTAANLVVGQWNHLALVRSGNALYLFSNGVINTSGGSGWSIISGAPAAPAGGSKYYFGGHATAGGCNCFFSDIRITTGRPVYGGPFGVPTTALTTAPTFGFTISSLMHFEDGNNTTVFTDDTGNQQWVQGGSNGACTETTLQHAFGNGSLAVPGTDSNINAPFNKNSPLDIITNFQDWTIECFVYVSAYPGSAKTIVDASNAGATGVRMNMDNTGHINIQSFDSGSVNFTTAGTVPTNTWTHVALVKRGESLQVFIAGVGQGSNGNITLWTAPLPSSGSKFLIGSSSGAAGFVGWIDEFRVVNNMAVYTQNFTPPTGPFRAPSNSPNTITKIWYSKPFMGFPYVVAQFSDGSVRHFWLQSNGNWTANTMQQTGAIVLPNTPNGLAYQATRVMPVNPLWSTETQIALGTVIEPNTYTGFCYRAVAVAGASPHTGQVEPTWPTATGGIVQEFGDFSTNVAAPGSTTNTVTATPLGSNITNKYGNSATLLSQAGTSSTQSTSAQASTAVTTWAPGTIYSPGAVVRPTTSQGAFINAIPNGDFEAGDDGNWIKSTNASISGTPAPYQGSLNGVLNCNHSTESLTMNTFGAVTGGQSVTASAYFKINAVGADLTGNLVLRWYDGTDTFISSTTGPNVQGSGGWVNTTVTGNAPAKAAHCRVQVLASNGTTTRSMQVDLVTWNLSQASAVSQFLYEAVQAVAGASGTTEPTWPTIAGNTVVDNGVTWKAIGTSIITWQAIPIMQTGATEPVWPTTFGVNVLDGSTYTTIDAHVTNTSLSWQVANRQIQDPKCPQGIPTAIGASHVFNGNNDIANFCAVVNPTDWSTANNAGYLPTGLNNYGDNPVAALALYRGNLIAFNSSGYQMWQIDPDPQNMAFLDAQPVGSVWPQAAQSVANDLLFLTEVGVRNLGTIGATANMAIGDTGQPVDPLVVAQLKAAIYKPYSLYYPGRGQYWLIFGPQAFVLTVNGRMQKTWSRYTFPDTITDATLLNGVLYMRTAGNLVWQLDANTLVDDASTGGVGGANVNFNGVIQWPYLDIGVLGQHKQLEGLDIVGDGQVTIQIGWREDDPTTFNDNAGFGTSPNVTPPYTISAADTVPGTPIPIGPLTAPSYTIILTWGSNQAWTWEASNLYVTDNKGGGAFG